VRVLEQPLSSLHQSLINARSTVLARHESTFAWRAGAHTPRGAHQDRRQDDHGESARLGRHGRKSPCSIDAAHCVGRRVLQPQQNVSGSSSGAKYVRPPKIAPRFAITASRVSPRNALQAFALGVAAKTYLSTPRTCREPARIRRALDNVDLDETARRAALPVARPRLDFRPHRPIRASGRADAVARASDECRCCGLPATTNSDGARFKRTRDRVEHQQRSDWLRRARLREVGGSRSGRRALCGKHLRVAPPLGAARAQHAIRSTRSAVFSARVRLFCFPRGAALGLDLHVLKFARLVPLADLGGEIHDANSPISVTGCIRASRNRPVVGQGKTNRTCDCHVASSISTPSGCMDLWQLADLAR